MSKPDYLKYDGRKPEPPYETEQIESSTPQGKDARFLVSFLRTFTPLLPEADRIRFNAHVDEVMQLFARSAMGKR